MLMFSVKEQQLLEKFSLLLTSMQYIHIDCHRLNYGILCMYLFRVAGTVKNILFSRAIYLAARAWLYQWLQPHEYALWNIKIFAYLKGGEQKSIEYVYVMDYQLR